MKTDSLLDTMMKRVEIVVLMNMLFSDAENRWWCRCSSVKLVARGPGVGAAHVLRRPI